MTIRRLLLAAVVLAGAACDGPTRYPAPHGESEFATKPDGQWRLPGRVMEASGLAASPDGGLLVHDDEFAVVYEIDMVDARVGRSYSFGATPTAGDFEGVAVDSANRLYLITATGQLHRAPLNDGGVLGPIEVFDTGLRDTCEIEGLAFDAARDSLIIACKEPYLSDLKGFAVFRAWSVAREKLDPEYVLNIPVEKIASMIGVETFSPSGVDVDAASGRLIVVAARENALAELTPNGTVMSARRLSRLHVQAEGLAVGADGRLYIADEAGPRDGARIAAYPRRGHD